MAEKIKIGVCVMEKKVKCGSEVLSLYAPFAVSILSLFFIFFLFWFSSRFGNGSFLRRVANSGECARFLR